ncbi:MAG: hypothetical protein KAU20_08025 [Nanoarchaeota archaeon]|nr:hypothetical protein [Nanoarchaeota archaeon]
MRVEFYEEFPTKENLDKLKLIDFRTRLFIAAKSLDEFKKLEKQVKKINEKAECAYWPSIPNSYWISPFSNTEDLVKIFKELKKCKNHLLIDLEPPFLNIKLIIKNILKFRNNKKIIRKFLQENKKRITIAVCPCFSILMDKIGLNYDIGLEKSIMWYSSMLKPILNKRIKRNLTKIKDEENYSVSLGTIEKGMLGTEPILPPKDLEKDFEFVKKAGFKKVIIFRLGGLNKRYIKIIKKYV